MNERILNVAEGRTLDCSHCEFNKADPSLQDSCEDGLRVSWGVARCNSQQEGMQDTRPNASIKPTNPGVLISFDEEGLLVNSQYKVHPNRVQRFLARVVGFRESSWHPNDV